MRPKTKCCPGVLKTSLCVQEYGVVEVYNSFEHLGVSQQTHKMEALKEMEH